MVSVAMRTADYDRRKQTKRMKGSTVHHTLVKCVQNVYQGEDEQE